MAVKISTPLLAALVLEARRAPVRAIRSRAAAGSPPDAVGAMQTMHLFKMFEELAF